MYTSVHTYTNTLNTHSSSMCRGTLPSGMTVLSSHENMHTHVFYSHINKYTNVHTCSHIHKYSKHTLTEHVPRHAAVRDDCVIVT